MMYPTFVLVTRIVTAEVNSSFHKETSQVTSPDHLVILRQSIFIFAFTGFHWYILFDMFYYYSILNIPKLLINCNLAVVSNLCTNFCTTIYSLLTDAWRQTLSRMIYKSTCLVPESGVLLPQALHILRIQHSMLLTSSNLPNIQDYLPIFLEHFTSINAKHPSTDFPALLSTED